MKIVSACNFGYLPLTLNWLKSLELLGLQENVLLYSLDKKVQEALNEKGMKIYYGRLLSFQTFQRSITQFIQMLGQTLYLEK